VLRAAKPAVIEFPEDRLLRLYERRNPHARQEVIKLMGGATTTDGSKFVKKQMGLMEDGMEEGDAYDKVMADHLAELQASGDPSVIDAMPGFKSATDILAAVQEEESEHIKKAMRAELERAR
jgi:hypothetical protein